MSKGETGEWNFNTTYNITSSHPAYNSDDGEFAYVKTHWGGNPRYHMDLKVGTTPFSEDISTNTWTTSGDNRGHAVAYGNGHYVESEKIVVPKTELKFLNLPKKVLLYPLYKHPMDLTGRLNFSNLKKIISGYMWVVIFY